MPKVFEILDRSQQPASYKLARRGFRYGDYVVFKYKKGNYWVGELHEGGVKHPYIDLGFQDDWRVIGATNERKSV